MVKTAGPAALGAKLREVYADIFNASHSPQTATDDDLTALFNVHAGGSDDLVRLQMQTFKALCESAAFGGMPPGGPGTTRDSSEEGHLGDASGSNGGSFPKVKIDLHIHLPENKTTRDYEAIIQDIAKYIYGRGDQTRG